MTLHPCVDREHNDTKKDVLGPDSDAPIAGASDVLVYCHQREGMGLLEYQTMPSLREVAHDGWLCTFITQQ